MKLSAEDNHHSAVQKPPYSAENELTGRVRRFLHDRVPDSDGLSVETTGGTVILRGRMPSCHAKWLCLQCCQRVAGVIHIIDQLDVAEPKWRKQPK